MSDSDYIKTVWTVDKIRMRVDYETSEEFHFAVNGDGHGLADKSNKVILSFNDIQVCYSKELDIVNAILSTEDKTDFINTLGEFKIELDTITQSDMSHPVDIFNLYKRVSIFWKETQQILKGVSVKRLIGEKQ